MMSRGIPSRPVTWKRVEPSRVLNRPGGGGAFDDVTGKPFTWTGASYRQTNIIFDRPVNRIVVETKGRGPAWPHPVKALNLVALDDIRPLGDVARLTVLHKAGTLTLYSAAGGTAIRDFVDIYGEVAA
jgi:hypothetical protein